MTNGFENIGVDVVGRILYRVPSRSEAARPIIVIGDDVDARNAGIVHIDVVVGDVTAVIEREELPVTELREKVAPKPPTISSNTP